MSILKYTYHNLMASNYIIIKNNFDQVLCALFIAFIDGKCYDQAMKKIILINCHSTFLLNFKYQLFGGCKM